MDEKKKDLPEQAAIVQRDYETYAIAPHMPGGLTTPEQLRTIAAVAEKYGVKALKITSAQRIALVGIREEDLPAVWQELGMEKGQAIGLCVRSVKFCPGTTFCKRGKQDSVALGLKLDKLYHGMELPSKFKIGVSGCPNSCAESAVKDLGLIGMNNGYMVMVGGYASGRGRTGEVLFDLVETDKIEDVVARIIDIYRQGAKKGQRLGRMLEKVGLDLFRRAVEAEGEEREKVLAEIKEKNA